MSLSQASELGTVYTPAELKEISAVAHAKGLSCTWTARVCQRHGVSGRHARGSDLAMRRGRALFRRTKAGALAAEAVIFFDPKAAGEFDFRSKRGGHLASKMRFVSAQLEAMLKNDLWRRAARTPTAWPDGSRASWRPFPGIEMAAPVETNMVFARMGVEKAAKLRAQGVQFHDWFPPKDGKVIVRIAAAFATPEEHVTKFLALART